jgi:peptidoglycan/xylan/chitin deacetylase (PgdA/CDA1 family)
VLIGTWLELRHLMPILCYHSIHDRWEWQFAVTPRLFAQHCTWLARTGRVLDLQDALQYLPASGGLRRDIIGISFDDGFDDFYHYAFPILIQHRLTATVFLVAGALDGESRAVEWVDDPPPFELNALTLDQVLEMQDAGIRFGSHSYKHNDLTLLTDDECERDLRTSRELLEDSLHGPVTLLAYPRGRYNERVRRAAQRAGFTHGFRTARRRAATDHYAVPRTVLYAGDGVGRLRLKSSSLYEQGHLGLIRSARRRIKQAKSFRG